VSGGGGSQTLSISGTGPFALQIGNPPVPATDVQGQIRGLIDGFNAIGTHGTPTARATGLRGQLDDFAAGLVAAVNEIHSGYSPGTKPLQPTITPAPAPLRTVGAFFDPNGITAGSIKLDASILADANNIAAGYSTAAGDNSIALRLGNLSSLVVPIPGNSPATPTSPATTAGPANALGNFYIGVISGLGVATRDALSRSEAEQTITQHLDSQRQDVSGVSIDEELADLIEHQHAYTAAARLVQIASDMMDEVVNLGR
ncbi:MAG: flagellar basal body rod C-terminal domain-containing protein, partial [Gemmatimonadota bacterium]